MDDDALAVRILGATPTTVALVAGVAAVDPGRSFGLFRVLVGTVAGGVAALGLPFVVTGDPRPTTPLRGLVVPLGTAVGGIASVRYGLPVAATPTAAVETWLAVYAPLTLPALGVPVGSLLAHAVPPGPVTGGLALRVGVAALLPPLVGLAALAGPDTAVLALVVVLSLGLPVVVGFLATDRSRGRSPSPSER